MKTTAKVPARSSVLGFTLIELMIVIVIVGILAAIAIPSYRRYAVVNSEREAQAKMQQLQIELEQWRARALSYQGFQPKIVNSSTNALSYAYADSPATNKTIYIPDGSDADTYRYKITLVDGGSAAGSLVTTASDTDTDVDTIDTITGRSWKMLAEPKNSGITEYADYFLLTSSGVRCSNSSKVLITATNCGTSQGEW